MFLWAVWRSLSSLRTWEEVRYQKIIIIIIMMLVIIIIMMIIIIIIIIIMIIIIIIIMIMLVPALPWVGHLEELLPVVLLFHPIPCLTPLETCKQLLSSRHHHIKVTVIIIWLISSSRWSRSPQSLDPGRAPRARAAAAGGARWTDRAANLKIIMTLVRIGVAMRIIMIFMITVMIILHWWWWLWRWSCWWWRPWQAVSTEQAEDLRRWESGTQFLFFSGPCKPFNIILINCKEWTWKRAEKLNYRKSPRRPPLGRGRGRKHVPRIGWGRAPWYCHHWCHHNITNISYRVFFHWYPPKKFKYGKPRLGESTLT